MALFEKAEPSDAPCYPTALHDTSRRHYQGHAALTTHIPATVVLGEANPSSFAAASYAADALEGCALYPNDRLPSLPRDKLRVMCLICGGRTRYFFSKTFNVFQLGEVDYWRCEECGFTISKTHAEMTPDDWFLLNKQYHAAYQGSEQNPDDPRWIKRLTNQAEVLSDAAQVGVLSSGGRWLDYACGDGRLSQSLQSLGHTLLKFDPYMARGIDYLAESALTPGTFDLVLTTSVFEHFTRRQQFDSVEALVARGGVLGLHTLVCERVPCDPTWFYLLPVHCAFHTNESMNRLFKQWGYAWSVYNVVSRLWLWFKPPCLELPERVASANRRPNAPSYILKDGFVDFWK